MNFGKRGTVLAVLLIAAAIFGAYANTFHAPLEFDDVSSIVDNPSIRSLWPPGRALSPPGGWGFTVSGRPVLNFSLAVNYAISGTDVWSYHLLNLLIHLAAALTLFGLIRRTLARPPLAARLGAHATPLALVIALLWALHPLQTEAVTYIIQRAESLMSLFILLTLYAFVRSLDSPRPRFWWAASFLACLLGSGTKELTALAPVLVFLYDRTFVSGGFRAAWNRHRAWHLSLAATWLPLAWVLAGTGGDRGGTFHFSEGNIWWGHALTQFEAVTRYLLLTFWPHPQVFDYGEIPPPGLLALLPWALPLLALLAAAVAALWRWPVAGFLGVCFFGILAPTSLLPATLQIIVEHRMYLPLAAVLAFLFGLLALRLGPRAAIASGALLAVAAAGLTLQRNAAYRSPRALWEDTVAKRPDNARALNNLGLTYYNLGRVDEAIALYRRSLELDPTPANTHYNLGLALLHEGRLEDAARSFEETVRIVPYYFKASLNLGAILMKLGRDDEARRRFAEAMRYDPDPAEVYLTVALALGERGLWQEAAENDARALALDPTLAEAQGNWGVALFQRRDYAGAAEHFTAALRLKPDAADLHFNLGLALAGAGRLAEAIAQYAEAVRLDPTLAAAQLNLGIALGQTGRLPEAIGHLQAAVRLQPEAPANHTNLAFALAQAGRPAEAVAEYEAAARLRPEDARAQYNLGYALMAAGRGPEARPHLEQALRLQPDFTAARDRLRQLESAAP